MEGNHLQARKRALSRNQISQHLDLGLPAPELGEINSRYYKPPGLWYFVMGVQADYDSITKYFFTLTI